MTERIFSIDAFRGLAVLIMIIVDAPPAESYEILAHSDWAGMTIADLAFPAFVFVMGFSAAISNSRRPATYKKIFVRAGLLFLIGMIFNEKWHIFSYLFLEDYTEENLYSGAVEHFRFFGILQRLALNYFFGMLIAKLLDDDKKICFAAFVLLMASSIGFHFYSPENPFNKLDNLSRAVDLIFPGANHIYLYDDLNDPEGLYGTIASTASMLFGFLAGKIFLYNHEKNFQLIIFGITLLIIGIGWSYFDIIAKKIWTAPFALINAGIGAIFMSMLLRTEKLKDFLKPLAALGKSPLFFFIASNVGIVFLIVIGFLHDTEIFCWVWAVLWIIIAVILDKFGVVIKI